MNADEQREDIRNKRQRLIGDVREATKTQTNSKLEMAKGRLLHLIAEGIENEIKEHADAVRKNTGSASELSNKLVALTRALVWATFVVGAAAVAAVLKSMW